MTLGDVLSLKLCKNGDELFEKLVSILARFDIEVFDSDGNDKSFYELCCDVAAVMNKGK